MDIHVQVEMYRGGFEGLFFLSAMSKCCDSLSLIVGISADQLRSIRSQHGPAIGSIRSRNGPAKEHSFTAWTS
jgi:hypothetical protein